MPKCKKTDDQTSQPRRIAWAATLVGLLALLAALEMAGEQAAWARPESAPRNQTVPTLTPTPTRPGQNPTDTPSPSQPTDTPQPGQPTLTPPPPPNAPPTVTPLPPALVPVAPVVPSRCWAVPTPGFAPVRQPSLVFEAQSDEALVVPEQTLHLRLLVSNRGSAAVRDVVICNPLVAALEPAQPTASQGSVRLEPEGLIAELGSLAAGQQAEVSVVLAIPADYPLGGVIENQAWLFAGDQQASTGLWTWALPPAWLPPTGDA